MLCICLEERHDVLARGDVREEDVARAVHRRGVRRREDSDLAEEARRRLDRLAHIDQRSVLGDRDGVGTRVIVDVRRRTGDKALVGGNLGVGAVDRGHVYT